VQREGWVIERTSMLAEAKQFARKFEEEKERWSAEIAALKQETAELRSARESAVEQAKSLSTELEAFKKNTGASTNQQLQQLCHVR
jgi:hypothetical protein